MTAFSEGFDSSVCSRMMHSAASLQRGSILVCKQNRAGTKPGSTDGPGRVALGRVILIVGAVGMLLLLVCPAFPVGVSVGLFGVGIKLARIAAGCIRWCCATT